MKNACHTCNLNYSRLQGACVARFSSFRLSEVLRVVGVLERLGRDNFGPAFFALSKSVFLSEIVLGENKATSKNTKQRILTSGG